MSFSKKSSKKPDETRKFARGNMKIGKVGDFAIGLGTYQPGWRWSESVKPIVKTNSCQAHHVGYAISGKMAGVMDDGTKWVLNAGDFVDLHPGHDAWVVGKKPFVLIDFIGAAGYAKK